MNTQQIGFGKYRNPTMEGEIDKDESRYCKSHVAMMKEF